MALLTRKERKSLDRDGRQALREERRKERRAERREAFAKAFSWEKFRALAAECILDVAAEVLPGEEKMEDVLDEIADRIDEFVDFSVLGFVGNIIELVDGIILRFLIREFMRPTIQAVYDELKATGRLPKKEEE